MQLDREVLELLRHEPELLAIADAITATLGLGAASATHVSRDSGRMLPNDEAGSGDVR